MITETYENCNEEMVEAEEMERRELLEKIGLEIETVPVHFPEITPGDTRVWEVILPFKTSIDRYKGYIPTKVLRVYEHHRVEFEDVEIWSDRDNDPLLVGKIKNAIFMLARWGKEIEKFEVVKERAKEVWKRKRKAKIEMLMSALEHDVEAHFVGEYVTYIG